MPRPVILLAFANDRRPAGVELRNLGIEATAIQEALADAREHGLCDVVVLEHATTEHVIEAVRSAEYRQRIAVFHFAGHSAHFDLQFEGPRGERAAVDGRALAELFGPEHGLQLVFLNACATEPQAEYLTSRGIPLIVATADAVADDVATDFARHFYRAVGEGTSLAASYEHAASAIKTQRGLSPEPLYRGVGYGVGRDRWPWRLYRGAAAQTASAWTLAVAGGDPLFGLPRPKAGQLPKRPFRHLAWYEPEEWELFLGRGREIRELYERVTDPDGPPVLLVHGQSGVGKSSLLSAGLRPRLEIDREVKYVRRNRTLGLTASLQAALGIPSLDGAGWKALEQLHRPIVVILDQLEEAFTKPLPQPNEFTTFLQTLKGIFATPGQRPAGRLILSFRKEWSAEVIRGLRKAGIPHAELFVAPLDADDIVEIVEAIPNRDRLASYYNLTVEAGVARLIATDLCADRGAAIAPTLQVLLSKMWDVATEGTAPPRFTADMYQRLKERGLLLRDFLEEQLAAGRVSHPHLVESGLALDVLAYHVTEGNSSEDRDRSTLETDYRHVLPSVRQAVSLLKDLYLLTDLPTDQQPPQDGTRLAHDELALPVRRASNASDAPGQFARRILDTRVQQHPHPTRSVLAPWELERVEQGRIGTRALTVEEEDLLDRSRKQADAATWSRTRWQIARAALGITTALVILTLAFTWHAGRIYEARELAAEALAEIPNHSERSLSLALQSFERNAPILPSHGADLQAQNALQRALEVSHLAWTIGAEWTSGARTDANDVAFSADGRLMVVGTADPARRVQVWNAQRREHRCHVPFNATPWAVAITRDGRQIAAAGDEGRIVIADADCRVVAERQLGAASVHALAYDPKGAGLAVGTGDGQLRIMDPLSGNGLVTSWTVSPQHGSTRGTDDRDPFARVIRRVRFSPDGTVLGSVGYDGALKLWNATDGTLLRTITEGVWIVGLAFSPDGNSVAVAASRPVVTVYTRPSGASWRDAPLHTTFLRGHSNAVRGVAFSPDGRQLASGGVGHSVLVHAATGELLLRLPGHAAAIVSTEFNPATGQVASTSEDGTVRIWDRHPPLPEFLDHPILPVGEGAVRWVAWGADAMLAAGVKGLVRTDPTTRNAEVLESGRIVAFAADAPGARAVIVTADKKVVALDAAAGRSATRHLVAEAEGAVTVAASRSDGQVIATGQSDGQASASIHVWDVARARLTRFDNAHTNVITGLAFSPDGRWLAASSADFDATIIALGDTGKKKHTLRHPAGQAVTGLAFSADGRRVMTICLDGRLRWWRVDDGQEEFSVEAHNGPIATIAVGAAGHVATADREGNIKVMNADTGDSLLTFASSPVTSLVFSPDGTRLAAAQSDGRVRIHLVDRDQLLAVGTSRRQNQAPRCSGRQSCTGEGSPPRRP